MATLQLFFQSVWAKDLSAPLYLLFFSPFQQKSKSPYGYNFQDFLIPNILKFQTFLLDIMLKETKKGRVKEDGNTVNCSDIQRRLKVSSNYVSN